MCTGCMFEDMEIPDGERVSPHNQPCKICTCNKGVITCEEPACNCSTWKTGSGRDLCCPQCDPKESCLHQELKHIVFRSGEQWIYQCQTCECLVSFIRLVPFLLVIFSHIVFEHQYLRFHFYSSLIPDNLRYIFFIDFFFFYSFHFA